ncbi:DUF655 domain-containing protein, partial [Desulfurobacterium sp.]|uniref:DUF655 domain-containing protein n=1 Tax=Desulfurobacterium sp. TaxID=2004706 RepID=UPI002636DA59
VKTLDEVFQALPELENILTEVEKQVIRRIEGLIKQVGVHAAGVIIAPDKLTKFIPLCLDKDKRVTSQFDMGMVESLGLLKMDFLGLDTLTIIDNTVKSVKKNYGVEIDIYNLPLNDRETFATLQKGDTTGVFQLESEGMKNLLRKLKPEKFEELIALVALYRPGPLSSGMVDSYIKRKHGLEEIDYIFPELEPVLKETYGLFIYQEQIMQIANILAGYSLGEADLLRRAMGKKKKEIMEEQRKIFIERAVKNGYPREKIEHLFDQIAKFAEYGFNKSHSTAYAYLSYVTAYLKTHYPVEFYASIMSVQYSKRDKLLRVIKDAKEHGIEILPPDVNVSEEDFKAVNGKIYYSLSGIKGIEKETAGLIVEERKKNGEFKSFNDFKNRFKGVRRINKKVLEKLTMAGAFDSLEDRKKLISHLKGIEEYLISDRIIMEYERETLGLYIKHNPLDQVKWFPYENPDPETFVADKEVEIFGIISNLEVKAKKDQSKWAKMELLTDSYSIQVTISGYVLEKYYPYLAEGNFISVKGIVAISEDDKENKTIKVRAREIKHISEMLNITGYYELDARGKNFQEKVFALSRQIEYDDNGIPFIVKAELEDAEVLMKIKENISLNSPVFQNGAEFAIIKPKKQEEVVGEKSSKNTEDSILAGIGDDNLFT